jgi:Taurine catabolism dioxygenase TauD, TfdA family
VFCRGAQSPALRLDFILQPGDIQLLHNLTMVHTRSEYVDWEVRQGGRTGTRNACVSASHAVTTLERGIGEARLLADDAGRTQGSLEGEGVGGLVAARVAYKWRPWGSLDACNGRPMPGGQVRGALVFWQDWRRGNVHSILPDAGASGGGEEDRQGLVPWNLRIPLFLPPAHQEDEKKRHLLRLWVAPPPPDRELPRSYEEGWGALTVGDRGGIRVPGYGLTLPVTAEDGFFDRPRDKRRAAADGAAPTTDAAED